MPIGIFTDVSATLCGALVGCVLSARLGDRWKKLLNNLLGIAAIVMGIVLIIRAKNLSAVILALLLGALVGEAIRLEDRINSLATAVTGRLMGGGAYLAQVSAALILFCCGGTGWFGALNEGLTGDGSILVTKAILDCVTACIFAALLGKIIPCLCLPQLCVYMALFGVAHLVQGAITDVMIADFSAVGGIVTFVAGLRLCKIKEDIKGLNLLPGLILAFFVSAAWTALVG